MKAGNSIPNLLNPDSLVIEVLNSRIEYENQE